MKKLLLTLGTMTIFTCMSNVFADQGVINNIEKAGHLVDVKALQRLEHSQEDYDAALARYRLAITYGNTSRMDEASASLAKSANQLEVLLKDKPNNVEVLALLGLVYSTQAGFTPSQAAKYGLKADRSIAKAKSIAPNNPRVNLVAGINSYFTPTEYGGSKTAAINQLSDAIANYHADEESGYHWGYAEAYVWRGLSHMKLGEHAKALSDWKEAIAIAPDYEWVNMLLNKHK